MATATTSNTTMKASTQPEDETKKIEFTTYVKAGFSFVHFLDYAQLKNSRKSEFLAKNLSFQPKNRWVFLEILSFSKVY